MNEENFGPSRAAAVEQNSSALLWHRESLSTRRLTASDGLKLRRRRSPPLCRGRGAQLRCRFAAGWPSRTFNKSNSTVSRRNSRTSSCCGVTCNRSSRVVAESSSSSASRYSASVIRRSWSREHSVPGLERRAFREQNARGIRRSGRSPKPKCHLMDDTWLGPRAIGADAQGIGIGFARWQSWRATLQGSRIMISIDPSGWGSSINNVAPAFWRRAHSAFASAATTAT